jgi:predicted transcriptional regulator
MKRGSKIWTVRERVEKYIHENSGPFIPNEISNEIGASLSAVRAQLNAMVNRGRIRRTKVKAYAHKDWTSPKQLRIAYVKETN